MNYNKPIFKAGILSLSLVSMAAPAIAATLPFISEALPSVSQTSIEMLMSVPNLGILSALLLSPFIINLIGKRPTVLSGLVIALISGIVPFFTLNYTAMLVSRFLLGFGLGLFDALATALINITYEGATREKLLGYSGAVQAFGSSLLTLLVGILMGINWRTTFLIYLIILVPLVLFGIFVPKLDVDKVESQKGEQKLAKEKISINMTIIMYAIYLFLVFSSFITVVFRLAPLVIEGGYGTAAQASMISALRTGVGFISGLTFGIVKGRFKESTAPLSLGFMGILFIGLSLSNTLLLTTIISVLIGIFFGYINPSVFSAVAKATDKASQTVGITILIIAINLGVALNPILLSFAGQAFNNHSIGFSLTFTGSVLLLVAIIQFILVKKFPISTKKVTST